MTHTSLTGTVISMQVTLAQLRPFDLNPRLTRNPHYDEMKDSIFRRGLDNPPPITQRPGEVFFIIASGGNTRLSILNELWQETGDTRFWEIYCLFHPWPDPVSLVRGNLKCLVGHLVENELHGGLSFIERALAIAKARELYEQEINTPLSQNNLAQKLREDGYPILQPHISRMEKTLEYLFPYIPEALYDGLGRHQIEKLLVLRNSAQEIWTRYAGQEESGAFDELFAGALRLFNGPASSLFIEHINDEVLGLMSQALNIDYNLLALYTDSQEQKRRSLLGPTPEPPPYQPTSTPKQPARKKSTSSSKESSNISPHSDSSSLHREEKNTTLALPEETELTHSQPLIPPITLMTKPTQESPEVLPRLSTGIASPALPAIDDIWHIDELFDYPESLCSMADRIAWDLATTCLIEDTIIPAMLDSPGVGFTVSALDKANTNEARACWQLLSFLSSPATGAQGLWQTLILGDPNHLPGWNDTFMINVFRLIRIIRRIREQQTGGIL